jgi:hypothetical protein
LTTDPTNDSKSKPQNDTPPFGEKKDGDPGQETDQPADAEREPLPIEFREFTASIRELFREIKKFIIFIRHRHNANAALIFLTFLLAIAAIAQAIIYGIQLGPLRKSADTGAKQLANFENAEAGRLEVNFCLVPNDAHAATFIVRNIGHSAATDIAISGGDGEGGIDSHYTPSIWEPNLQPIPPNPVGGILGAGEEHKYPVRLPDITQKMRDGAAYSFIYMNFGYDDIFGHQGSAQACIHFDPSAGGHWADCPTEHTRRATTPFTGMNGSFPGYCDTDALEEIRKQTLVQRQQLVGTQQAIINPVFTYQREDGTISLTADNRGQFSVGTLISIRAEMITRRISDNAQLGSPALLSFALPSPIRLPANRMSEHPTFYRIPKPIHEMMKNGWKLNKTINLRGELTYYNGFGDIHESFCYEWVPPFKRVNADSVSPGLLEFCKAGTVDIIKSHPDQYEPQ